MGIDFSNLDGSFSGYIAFKNHPLTQKALIEASRIDPESPALKQSATMNDDNHMRISDRMIEVLMKSNIDPAYEDTVLAAAVLAFKTLRIETDPAGAAYDYNDGVGAILTDLHLVVMRHQTAHMSPYTALIVTAHMIGTLDVLRENAKNILERWDDMGPRQRFEAGATATSTMGAVKAYGDAVEYLSAISGNPQLVERLVNAHGDCLMAQDVLMIKSGFALKRNKDIPDGFEPQ